MFELIFKSLHLSKKKAKGGPPIAILDISSEEAENVQWDIDIEELEISCFRVKRRRITAKTAAHHRQHESCAKVTSAELDDLFNDSLLSEALAPLPADYVAMTRSSKKKAAEGGAGESIEELVNRYKTKVCLSYVFPFF